MHQLDAGGGGDLPNAEAAGAENVERVEVAVGVGVAGGGRDRQPVVCVCVCVSLCLDCV